MSDSVLMNIFLWSFEILVRGSKIVVLTYDLQECHSAWLVMFEHEDQAKLLDVAAYTAVALQC